MAGPLGLEDATFLQSKILTALVHSGVDESPRCFVRLVSMLVQIRILVHDERGVLLVTGLLQSLVNSDGIACVGLVNHRVPPDKPSVRGCSRLPESLEHVLLSGDLSVGKLPRWLLCAVLEDPLSNPRVAVFREVPVGGLGALLLAYDHRMLQVTLWLLKGDVLLV